MVEYLAKAGIVTDTLVMVASALHSDIAKSGIQRLVNDGKLQKVVVYCSPDDRVIRNLQKLPGAYGSLGARGLQLAGEPVGTIVTGYEAAPPFANYVTRWFGGFGHSDWFNDAWIEATFSTALGDMGFDEPIPF